MLSSPTLLYPPLETNVNQDSALTHKVVWGKRLFDIVASSLVILVVMSWLVPLLALAIRLSSPGPILFVQLRTGRNGRPFRCFKFRTMTHDPKASFKQATKNDSRVTSIGRILRKTNLDELPQVFNVLLGQMSVVGPRPHAIQHDAQFWSTLPGYPDRYIVKPGITGLAQVRGCRGETDTVQKMKHRVQFDHFYIRKQTLILDLKICWWTVEKMIKGDEKAH
ncbi:sugar transferase [Fibrisoma montanum]|uniref:Sugar transferase n=1 Tax=Fibrisoma montanum TaxID=2305895 RepID=A0A418MAK7_9BACT|nr:sugar transferase [Fibrisoma montanum]RIV23417.1 sugar transferase [Fibrisoma montanum]